MGDKARVLNSWKEIAAYLGKGVRTVQRWEQTLGLPVKRPNGAGKDSVFASTDELDQWLAMGWAQRKIVTNETLAPSISEHRRLRQTNRELIDDVERAVRSLKSTFEELALPRRHGK